MTVWIALVRGINIGGHKKVAMSDLRDMATDLGFARPQTLAQSGNLVFSAPGRSAAKIEALMERESERCIGVSASFFLRNAAEWQALIAANPFAAEAEAEPSKLAVIFLKAAPGQAALRDLASAYTGPERIEARSHELYAFYPEGMGRSKLTLTLIERKLHTTGTGRNWNTVLKLADLAANA